jgi:hypothetical protein
MLRKPFSTIVHTVQRFWARRKSRKLQYQLLDQVNINEGEEELEEGK